MAMGACMRMPSFALEGLPDLARLLEKHSLVEPA